METIFINTENSKIYELHRFVFIFSQGSDLKISNENNAIQNFSIYSTWKNITQQYKNNEIKIIAATCYNEFELIDVSSSVSDIQFYIKYIIKSLKHYPLILLPIFVSIGLITD